MQRATTNTRLVSFETAAPFVPYVSALKDGVLRHRAEKQEAIEKLYDAVASMSIMRKLPSAPKKRNNTKNGAMI